jgi:thioesterase domain-containing protein/acyl carrier protein
MNALPDDVFLLPTSLVQKRYWLLDQLVPGNPALNMPLAFRLAGPLDVPALERALSDLAIRHEILRASFDRVGADVMEIVRQEAAVSLDVVDLSTLPAAERDQRTEELVLEEARKPFVLARGPLLRTSLVRRAENDHVLLVTMHHIVCDGWSNGIVVREIGELYRAAVEGGPPRLPDLSIQFADFANWQQEWLRGEKFDEAFDYWRGQLSGSLPPLEIPTDRPRRPGIAAPGVIETLLLDKPLSDALKIFGRQVDATPFMLFFAAFVALLSRWSRQKDVLVSSPAANRQHVETESLIGPFANPLLLRADLTGSPTLRALVLRVRELALAAFSFAELPFEKLIEWQETTLKQVPYAPRVMFIYQSAFMQPVALPGGLTLTPRRSVSPGSAFELMQSVVERAEGQRLQLEYNPDLFDASTIARFLNDYETLLRAIATTPDALLADVKIETAPRKAPVSGERPIPAALPALVAPKDDAERKLVAIWEEVLDTSPIGVQDNYFELGGHSLLAVRIMTEIEKQFGKQLPLATLVQTPTIAELAGLLRDRTWSASWSSLVPIQPEGTKPPFYCVHAAGGNVLTYFDLARHLGPDQPVYGLQARGLDGKQPPHNNLEEMARDYIKEIREFQPEGPYYVGGTSFGGMIAFEIAQQLVAQGQTVGVLALFDTYGPGYPRYVPGTSRRRTRYHRLLEQVDLHAGNLLAAEGLRAKLSYLGTKSIRLRHRGHLYVKKLRQNVFNVAFRPFLVTLRKVEEASRKATVRYQPKPYPGRVTLFRASQQPRGIYPEPEMGWSGIAGGGVEVFEVPGHHGAVVYEPRAGILARELARCLEKAYARQAHASGTDSP